MRMRTRKILFLGTILVVLSVCYNAIASENTTETPKKYIAIIIDDFGNNSEGTKEMLELPIKITAAVMPSMPSSEKDAKDFTEAGKDVILHLPMEAEKGKASWLGDSPILTSLNDEEIRKRVESGLNSLGTAVGINNHMGSKITKNEDIMRKIAQIAFEKDLIIIDSKTSPFSKVKSVCENMCVKHLERDVFLDGTKDSAQIAKRLYEAGRVAQKKGYAVAIGHVGAEGGMATVNAIKSAYPELQKAGIEFVTVTELHKILNPITFN